jgi:hypothetical protein
MLELRPNCECCDLDLPPDTANAVICTYECTFRTACSNEILSGRCPNCGGSLTPRPIRPADKLSFGGINPSPALFNTSLQEFAAFGRFNAQPLIVNFQNKDYAIKSNRFSPSSVLINGLGPANGSGR